MKYNKLEMNAARVRTAPAMALRKFSGFKPETEKPSRKPEVQPNPTQAALLKAWSERQLSLGRPDFEEQCFRVLVGKTLALRQVRITSEDITAFCISLANLRGSGSRDDEELFSNKAGLFLSALIYLSKDTRFFLPLDHLGPGLNFLCYHNNKDVRIKGDVGLSLGEMMSGGRIELEGNCYMHLGCGMTGGTIIVSGDSDDDTGYGMRGGEIRVSGRIAGYDAEIEGGRIYEAGELLVEGGVSDEDY